nr:MAG TPA: hypothetical protein [Caudoviricetes sp.]
MKIDPNLDSGYRNNHATSRICTVICLPVVHRVPGTRLHRLSF